MCSVKPQTDLSHKGRAVEEWADLHFFRPIGIRIARALQPTGISADQVTLWSLVIGLVAGHLFAYQDRWTNVIGFGLSFAPAISIRPTASWPACAAPPPGSAARSTASATTS